MSPIKFCFSILILSLFFIFQACKIIAQDTSISQINLDITGTVEGIDNGTASINYFSLGSLERGPALKSINFTSKISSGKFEFKDSIPEPGTATFTIDGLVYNKSFYIDKGNFSIHARKNTPGKIEITGSKLNDEDAKLEIELSAWNKRRAYFDSVTELVKTPADTLSMQSGRSAMQFANKRFINALKNSISEYSENYVVLNMLLALIIEDENLDAALDIYRQLASAVQNAATGKIIGREIAARKKLVIGSTYPDFTVDDVNGKLFSLSSLRGHIVVLDFWASYCLPCRAEAPDFSRAYQNLHGKGLEIVSFSEDTDPLKWKQAVKKDNVIWRNVSDLKGMKGIASIRIIPAVYILDKNGIIVAKNLSGPVLYNKLEELCNMK